MILMTYGSATTAEHVAEYFERIYKGKASTTLIEDFTSRYRLIGRSPLIEITREQAVHLEESLGKNYVVRAGMRHSAPFIEEAVRDCRDAGADSLIGIILSPQFSSFIMEGYKTVFMEAARTHGFESKHTIVAGPWGTEPHFIELLANRIRKSLTELKEKYGSVPVIFTTHSMPRSVVEKDPNYLKQLEATIAAIRNKLDQNLVWYAAYQSAGHTPEEWLTPDLADILNQLHEKKTSAVLIVPIQFLTDHLEILYDLDSAARKQCETLTIAYHRTSLPNSDPLFIKALHAIVKDTKEKLVGV